MTTQPPATHFDSATLRFRAFGLDDVADVYRLQDPKLCEFLPGLRGLPTAHTDDEARQKIVRWQNYGNAHPGLGYWHCSIRATQEFVGQAFFIKLVGSDSIVQYGGVAASSAWGRNTGFETSQAALRYAFDVLGLPYLTTLVLSTNRSALAVTQATGFSSLMLTYQPDITLFYMTRQRWSERVVAQDGRLESGSYKDWRREHPQGFQPTCFEAMPQALNDYLTADAAKVGGRFEPPIVQDSTARKQRSIAQLSSTSSLR